MATQRQLKARWLSSPGKEIQERLYAIDFISLGHGHKSDELFSILNGLPYRDDVANGRDFRGLNFAARELDLSYCNFAYGLISYFYFCNLDHSVFDGCFAERATFHSNLTACSFVGVKLRSCYFNDSVATNCNFSNARLVGCSFQNTDLRESRFSDADCRGATFAGANLLGCDFRGANLEEAVFCDVILDKSTDFRGANLSNIHTADWHDSQGKVTRKGVDLSQATI